MLFILLLCFSCSYIAIAPTNDYVHRAHYKLYFALHVMYVTFYHFHSYLQSVVSFSGLLGLLQVFSHLFLSERSCMVTFCACVFMLSFGATAKSYYTFFSSEESSSFADMLNVDRQVMSRNVTVVGLL